MLSQFSLARQHKAGMTREYLWTTGCIFFHTQIIHKYRLYLKVSNTKIYRVNQKNSLPRGNQPSICLMCILPDSFPQTDYTCIYTEILFCFVYNWNHTLWIILQLAYLFIIYFTLQLASWLFVDFPISCMRIHCILFSSIWVSVR